jgi:dienelactone hydrolase
MRTPFLLRALSGSVFLVLSSCYLYPSGGNSGRQPGTTSTTVEGCRKQLTLVDGCLGPFMSETAMLREAQRRGMNIQRFDYAPPAENAKGECQTRYLNYYVPQGKPKGIFFYFHGGGGDVGSADHGNIMKSCAELCSRGYVVANIEYRRGWTGTQPLDQWCEQRDPHDEPAAHFKRERKAVLLAFEDAELAVRFAYKKAEESFGKLPSYSTGASFGGTLASYVGYGTPNLARDIKLQGVLNQYGGLAKQDPLYPTVPYFGAGGVEDDLVPFWEGRTYVSPHGEFIYGTGGLGMKLRSMGVEAYVAATCNMGHSRGAISESKLVDDFLNWLNNPRSQTKYMERVGNRGITAMPSDSCYVSWEQLGAAYR